MNSIFKNLILGLLIFGFACSSSSNEVFTDTPPPKDTPKNPPSFQIAVVSDSFEGEDFVVAGSEGWNFMVAYKTMANGKTFHFEAVKGALPIIMKDDEGSNYNIFGLAVDGVNEGTQLTPMNAFMGYWFSWGAFYPGLEIYESSIPLQNTGSSVQGSNGWLVPRDQVIVGALRDAIPAIDDPQFTSPKDEGLVANLKDDALVIGVLLEDEARAYPHFIMNWHEIVNDKIGNTSFSVVFCPLTGTATVWNRVINNQETTFGVSGFLYNSNVVPYDRNTNSNWSQMLQLSVQGQLQTTPSQNLFVLETSVETWKAITTGSKILSTNTGYNREYRINPYGNYPTNSAVNFPVNFTDTRLHPKERVLGVLVNGKAKAYRFASFK
ncbi:DUF3179 domain-containing (seleno)protein [Ancylomarina longa]|uniref:DUF3179 domain-containing protein n=1 Tax=Ancylomarina longa TaxID=2487017 RepID=A0A434AT83_9BACT|nr:DUF3179 domain-containing (seleno)protein [Ancylomarina longa]RUT77644.1 DUF3179 domain-containing protein [Ancylomarina longa]